MFSCHGIEREAPVGIPDYKLGQGNRQAKSIGILPKQQSATGKTNYQVISFKENSEGYQVFPFI